MTRQAPLGSSAVRALNILGNGTIGTSRPSTPTPSNPPVSMISGTRSMDIAMNMHGPLSHRLNKVIVERQNAHHQKSSTNNEEDGRLLEIDMSQNGKNDSWQEDQEV